MTMPESDRLLLTARCITADIEEAIDVAFLGAAMIRDILGEDADRLGGRRLDASRRAKPMVAGWARAGALFGRVGGVVSGEGPELVQASRPRDPPPGRAPCTVPGAGGPTLVSQGTRGTNPSGVRSSRHLVSFTRNNIKNSAKNTPLSPPRPHLLPK